MNSQAILLIQDTTAMRYHCNPERCSGSFQSPKAICIILEQRSGVLWSMERRLVVNAENKPTFQR